MSLFYYKLIGDIENETKFLKSFKLSDCRDSYKEFISLIHLIYLYNSTTTSANKIKIKTRYLNLSKKLNYSYFSEDFLLNYFDQILSKQFDFTPFGSTALFPKINFILGNIFIQLNLHKGCIILSMTCFTCSLNKYLRCCQFSVWNFWNFNFYVYAIYFPTISTLKMRMYIAMFRFCAAAAFCIPFYSIEI